MIPLPPTIGSDVNRDDILSVGNVATELSVCVCGCGCVCWQYLVATIFVHSSLPLGARILARVIIPNNRPSPKQNNNNNNMAKLMLAVLLGVLLSTDSIRGDDSIYFPLLMPEVQPTAVDSYLCTAFRMPTHEHNFIGKCLF